MSNEANYTFDHNASLFLYQIFPPNLFLNMNMGKKPKHQNYFFMIYKKGNCAGWEHTKYPLYCKGYLLH